MIITERALTAYIETEKLPGHHFAGAGKVMSKPTIASSLPPIGCETGTPLSFWVSGRALITPILITANSPQLKVRQASIIGLEEFMQPQASAL